jgi:predicted metal-dependent hydrolase
MAKIKIDKIIRSARKSFSIVIDSDATVIVRAPLHSTMSEIQDVVSRKSEWIIAKQSAILEKLKSKKKKDFVTGEKFLFKGTNYPLEIRNDFGFVFAFKEGRFLLNSGYIEHGRVVFEHWYKRVARGVILERAVYFSGIMNLKFNGFRITSAETRWGSCSGRKNINFAWKLVMAPPEIIDYVVVHEIAHLAQMNHSREFWAIVQGVLPDYKKRKKWLKDNGHLLEV